MLDHIDLLRLSSICFRYLPCKSTGHVNKEFMPSIAAIMSYLFPVEHSEVYNITPSSGLEVESVFHKVQLLSKLI